MSTLAKVFLLTKDEYDLIEDFIFHYGNLVGYENLVIIDNGSTHPHVLDVYKKYSQKGLKSIYQNKSPMLSMGSMLTAYMKHHKDTCKFMLPFDTDEFVFFPGKSTITREDFEEFLNSIPDDVSIIKYRKIWNSVPDPSSPSYVGFKHSRPAKDITDFAPIQNFDKVFVRSTTFEQMAIGNHNAVVSQGRLMEQDTLGMLHFNETGAFRLFERTTNAIIGYNYMTMNQSVPDQMLQCLTYRACAGGHHCMNMVRYLIRMNFINKWMMRFGQCLPTQDHVEWLDMVLYRMIFDSEPDTKDSNMNIMITVAQRVVDKTNEMIIDYIAGLSDNVDTIPFTDASKLDFIFGKWKFTQASDKIHQVSTLLEGLPL